MNSNLTFKPIIKIRLLINACALYSNYYIIITFSRFYALVVLSSSKLNWWAIISPNRTSCNKKPSWSWLCQAASWFLTQVRTASSNPPTAALKALATLGKWTYKKQLNHKTLCFIGRLHFKSKGKCILDSSATNGLDGTSSDECEKRKDAWGPPETSTRRMLL